MEYEFLNKEEKREILKNKLTVLEQQHYELSEMLRALGEGNGFVDDDVRRTLQRQMNDAELMHEGMLKEYRTL